MDDWLTGAVRGGIAGGIAGGLIVLLFGLLGRQKKCPECSEPLPRFRKPRTFQQMLWGGWTCDNCGCEVDRRGKKRKQ